MDRLEKMKECLMSKVEGQIYGNLENVDAKELGEAVDMIKDLSEAVYYCTITKAMQKDKSTKGQEIMYYSPQKEIPDVWPIEYYDPRHRSRYAQGGSSRGYSEGNIMYHDLPPIYRDGKMIRDPQEGKSGWRRKMYMEGKGSHDKTAQMKELENYMQELSEDLTEMIHDASPEEKQLLQQKISILATKIK